MLTGGDQRGPTSALTARRVGLAVAVSLPDRLTLLEQLFLSFFFFDQRREGDLFYVQRAEGLSLCVLAVSRLSAQHSGVARLYRKK